MLRPFRSCQWTKASGPRHCTSTESSGTPSSVTGRSLPGKKNSRVGDLDSRHARQQPQASADKASGQAAGRGISEASIEKAARIPSSDNAPATQREGRHSSRQLADPLDE